MFKQRWTRLLTINSSSNPPILMSVLERSPPPPTTAKKRSTARVRSNFQRLNDHVLITDLCALFMFYKLPHPRFTSPVRDFNGQINVFSPQATHVRIFRGGFPPREHRQQKKLPLFFFRGVLFCWWFYHLPSAIMLPPSSAVLFFCTRLHFST